MVDGALPPQSDNLPHDLKPLARRNAIEISHTRFNSDINRLISVLESKVEQNEKSKTKIDVYGKKFQQNSKDLLYSNNTQPLRWMISVGITLISSLIYDYFWSLPGDQFIPIYLIGFPFVLFFLYLVVFKRIHRFQYILDNIAFGLGAAIAYSNGIPDLDGLAPILVFFIIGVVGNLLLIKIGNRIYRSVK